MKELVAELIRFGNTAALTALETKALTDHGCDWRKVMLTKNGDTPCMLACRFGKVDVLRLFSSTDLERGNLEGKRPLHEAAQAGHILCVQYLLSKGVAVDCLKRADWTPLMLACTRDDPDLVHCLLQAGACPALCNKDGWNSLHIAAREGNTAVMSLLLSADPSCSLTRSNNGRSPLHTAALHGRLSAVELLLNLGCYHGNCCHANESGDYSTNLAENCGSAVHGDDSATLRDYCGSATHRDDSAPLRDNCGSAIHRDDSATLRDNCGSAVHGDDSATLRDYCGSAIHGDDSATLRDNCGSAIHRDDSATLRDNCGSAIHRDDSATLRDNCGSTPLMDALRGGHVEVARVLQQHLHHPDISLVAADGAGRLALHISAQTGALCSIQYLVVDCGTNPSIPAPISRDTPLHCAARDGQLETVKLLLKLGADPSHINVKGRTAYDVAKLNGHDECASELEQYVVGLSDRSADIT